MGNGPAYCASGIVVELAKSDHEQRIYYGSHQVLLFFLRVLYSLRCWKTLQTIGGAIVLRFVSLLLLTAGAMLIFATPTALSQGQACSSSGSGLVLHNAGCNHWPLETCSSSACTVSQELCDGLLPSWQKFQRLDVSVSSCKVDGSGGSCKKGAPDLVCGTWYFWYDSSCVVGPCAPGVDRCLRPCVPITL